MPPPGLQNGSFTPLPTTPFADSVQSSIHNASSLASIQNILSTLHTRDAAITSSLQSLISSQASLSRDLGRLDLLRAHLGTNAVHTRAISHGMLDNAASTAEKLSSKVKELDLEKKRVEETLDVVEQVAELKACVNGVVGSMGAPQDWEAAAGYIARASKIPLHIVEGNFAARIVPSVEVPDAPGVTIEAAKESLCGLFLREFETAAEEGDGVRITRFFKLFPLIGRDEVGLDVYGKYVCQGVAGTARKNLKEGAKGERGKEGFFYAQALTRLFEHIAQIVEGHGGLVERHYGAGKMVRVIERLQAEADVQGGIVLDTWGDEKNVDRRLTDVRSYPFSFLVQSFLPNQRPTGIPRTGSPAVGGAANGRASEDEGVDMKEVDGLLNEMAVMLGRWSLYTRFLSGKCRDPEASPDEPLIMPDLIEKSALSRKISNRLKDPFNVMTTFFFRRSVEKAFQLDESPTGLSLNISKPIDGNAPYMISAVDDVMYIVDTVLKRSISTSQRGVIESAIPAISRVLGTDFVGMIQRKMRDESYPKPLVQGGFPPEDKIIAFIVLINSLDVSNEYISRIVSSHVESSERSAASHTKGVAPASALKDIFPYGHDATFVSNSLNSLNTSFSSKTNELISEGLQVMFNNVIKPRLRPVLSETFRDVDYSLTSEDLTEIALQNDTDDDPQELLQDMVSHRFEYHWDALMKPIQRIISASPFNTLLDQTAQYLARVLERRVWNYSGKMNALGATRMERDYGGIVGVIARGGKYGLRDVFARVSQIAMLVNMDEEEWEAVNVEGDGLGEEEVEMVWVLTVEERNRARGMIRER